MKSKLVMLGAVICISAFAASAQDVYVNSSPSADFSSYHTFAKGEQPNPNQIANSFLAQEAQAQIKMQLEAKGLKLVKESENPDLVVVGSGGMKTQTSYNMYGTRMIGGGMGSISAQQNLEGTLVVDIYDVKAKELVWRGVAQGTLDQKNSQKNMKLVDKAVAKMFKKYPK